MKTIYTIGFNGKSASQFFEKLKQNEIKALIDVRLNNVSQLSGFTKKKDLEYFLREICDISYLHFECIAPTKEILNNYKNKTISWLQYEVLYCDLIEHRDIIKKISRYELDKACLLCSEAQPEHCHRRLAADIIKDASLVENIIHL